ncbi:hypothetical protein DIPPA_09648 [Diplonema papillatum]|nr:hypothetical protein DIPPA_09648 [Diplonema papillatum]
MPVRHPFASVCRVHAGSGRSSSRVGTSSSSSVEVAESRARQAIVTSWAAGLAKLAAPTAGAGAPSPSSVPAAFAYVPNIFAAVRPGSRRVPETLCLPLLCDPPCGGPACLCWVRSLLKHDRAMADHVARVFLTFDADGDRAWLYPEARNWHATCSAKALSEADFAELCTSLRASPSRGLAVHHLCQHYAKLGPDAARMHASVCPENIVKARVSSIHGTACSKRTEVHPRDGSARDLADPVPAAFSFSPSILAVPPASRGELCVPSLCDPPCGGPACLCCVRTLLKHDRVMADHVASVFLTFDADGDRAWLYPEARNWHATCSAKALSEADFAELCTSLRTSPSRGLAVHHLCQHYAKLGPDAARMHASVCPENIVKARVSSIHRTAGSKRTDIHPRDGSAHGLVDPVPAAFSFSPSILAIPPASRGELCVPSLCDPPCGWPACLCCVQTLLKHDRAMADHVASVFLTFDADGDRMWLYPEARNWHATCSAKALSEADFAELCTSLRASPSRGLAVHHLCQHYAKLGPDAARMHASVCPENLVKSRVLVVMEDAASLKTAFRTLATRCGPAERSSRTARWALCAVRAIQAGLSRDGTELTSGRSLLCGAVAWVDPVWAGLRLPVSPCSSLGSGADDEACSRSESDACNNSCRSDSASLLGRADPPPALIRAHGKGGPAKAEGDRRPPDNEEGGWLWGDWSTPFPSPSASDSGAGEAPGHGHRGADVPSLRRGSRGSEGSCSAALNPSDSDGGDEVCTAYAVLYQPAGDTAAEAYASGLRRPAASGERKVCTPRTPAAKLEESPASGESSNPAATESDGEQKAGSGCEDAAQGGNANEDAGRPAGNEGGDDSRGAGEDPVGSGSGGGCGGGSGGRDDGEGGGGDDRKRDSKEPDDDSNDDEDKESADEGDREMAGFNYRLRNRRRSSTASRRLRFPMRSVATPDSITIVSPLSPNAGSNRDSDSLVMSEEFASTRRRVSLEPDLHDETVHSLNATEPIGGRCEMFSPIAESDDVKEPALSLGNIGAILDSRAFTTPTAPSPLTEDPKGAPSGSWNPTGSEDGTLDQTANSLVYSEPRRSSLPPGLLESTLRSLLGSVAGGSAALQVPPPAAPAAPAGASPEEEEAKEAFDQTEDGGKVGRNDSAEQQAGSSDRTTERLWGNGEGEGRLASWSDRLSQQHGGGGDQTVHFAFMGEEHEDSTEHHAGSSEHTVEREGARHLRCDSGQHLGTAEHSVHMASVDSRMSSPRSAPFALPRSADDAMAAGRRRWALLAVRGVQVALQRAIPRYDAASKAQRRRLLLAVVAWLDVRTAAVALATPPRLHKKAKTSIWKAIASSDFLIPKSASDIGSEYWSDGTHSASPSNSRRKSHRSRGSSVLSGAGVDRSRQLSEHIFLDQHSTGEDSESERTSESGSEAGGWDPAHSTVLQQTSSENNLGESSELPSFGRVRERERDTYPVAKQPFATAQSPLLARRSFHVASASSPKGGGDKQLPPARACSFTHGLPTLSTRSLLSPTNPNLLTTSSTLASPQSSRSSCPLSPTHSGSLSHHALPAATRASLNKSNPTLPRCSTPTALVSPQKSTFGGSRSSTRPSTPVHSSRVPGAANSSFAAATPTAAPHTRSPYSQSFATSRGSLVTTPLLSSAGKRGFGGPRQNFRLSGHAHRALAPQRRPSAQPLSNGGGPAPDESVLSPPGTPKAARADPEPVPPETPLDAYYPMKFSCAKLGVAAVCVAVFLVWAMSDGKADPRFVGIGTVMLLLMSSVFFIK